MLCSVFDFILSLFITSFFLLLICCFSNLSLDTGDPSSIKISFIFFFIMISELLFFIFLFLYRLSMFFSFFGMRFLFMEYFFFIFLGLFEIIEKLDKEELLFLSSFSFSLEELVLIGFKLYVTLRLDLFLLLVMSFFCIA